MATTRQSLEGPIPQPTPTSAWAPPPMTPPPPEPEQAPWQAPWYGQSALPHQRPAPPDTSYQQWQAQIGEGNYNVAPGGAQAPWPGSPGVGSQATNQSWMTQQPDVGMGGGMGGYAGQQFGQWGTPGIQDLEAFPRMPGPMPQMPPPWGQQPWQNPQGPMGQGALPWRPGMQFPQWPYMPPQQQPAPPQGPQPWRSPPFDNPSMEFDMWEWQRELLPPWQQGQQYADGRNPWGPGGNFPLSEAWANRTQQQF